MSQIDEGFESLEQCTQVEEQLNVVNALISDLQPKVERMREIVSFVEERVNSILRQVEEDL